jgi:hypothetical protein
VVVGDSAHRRRISLHPRPIDGEATTFRCANGEACGGLHTSAGQHLESHQQPTNHPPPTTNHQPPTTNHHTNHHSTYKNKTKNTKNKKQKVTKQLVPGPVLDHQLP